MGLLDVKAHNIFFIVPLSIVSNATLTICIIANKRKTTKVEFRKE